MNLRAVVEGGGEIPADEINAVLPTDDLELLSIIEEVLACHLDRIRGELDSGKCCMALLDYYIRRLKDGSTHVKDTSNAQISQAEAATELCTLLLHWIHINKSNNLPISLLVASVTQAYRDGDEKLRYIIETSFLEHVFEDPVAKNLFADWEYDTILGKAYALGAQWADWRNKLDVTGQGGLTPPG